MTKANLFLFISLISMGFLMPSAGVSQNDFEASLSASGVFQAAREIGLDIETYLMPLVTKADHPYRSYRWSVGYAREGGVMISALPPEEEVGWTPWEQWYKNEKGEVTKVSLVLYPLKNLSDAGVAGWYPLNGEDGLFPRFLKKPGTLEEKLRLARVDVAARVLGFDYSKILIDPLSPEGKSHYMQLRWVVIPHNLADDMPVIYVLPPMNRSDDWPWESWYTDGKIPLLHHVHYTKPNSLAKESNAWKEYPGAPQRPPEIFGVVWYWFDDISLTPAWIDPEK